MGWSGQVFPARVGFSVPDDESETYSISGDAATALNSTACAEDGDSMNIIYQIGTRTGNCEVLKGTYLDYLLEHHFDNEE